MFPLPCVPSAPLSVLMCAAVGVVYTPHSPGSAHPAHLPAISSSPLTACTLARLAYPKLRGVAYPKLTVIFLPCKP